VLENLDENMDNNRWTWKSIIKCDVLKNAKITDQRKHTKLQQSQNPSQING